MRRPTVSRHLFTPGFATCALLLAPVLVFTQAASQTAGQGQQQDPEQVRIREGRGVVVHVGPNGPRTRRLADLPMRIPPDNPMSDAKIALGRRLFFDPLLSIDRTTSCATCHDPARAFADTKTLAIGVAGRVGKRHSPALINRGFGRMHFWDGRATTLEAQVLQPIEDPNEMAATLDEVVTRLAADDSYRVSFQEVFAGGVSAPDLGKALAAYLRTVKSGAAPFDRFIDGETTALSADAQAGLRIFRGKARCGICHFEPTFTDENFHNTGVAWRVNDAGAGAFQDDGRLAVTKNARDRGAFKTPTLREIARTAPYMHDGSLATLEDVVEFYNQGGRANPNLTRLLRPMNLTADEKRVLVVFLESLSGVVTGK